MAGRGSTWACARSSSCGRGASVHGGFWPHRSGSKPPPPPAFYLFYMFNFIEEKLCSKKAEKPPWVP